MGERRRRCGGGRVDVGGVGSEWRKDCFVARRRRGKDGGTRGRLVRNEVTSGACSARTHALAKVWKIARNRQTHPEPLLPSTTSPCATAGAISSFVRFAALAESRLERVNFGSSTSIGR